MSVETPVQETEQVFLALPIEVGQALVNYLQEQPYRETAGLIHALQSLQTVGGGEAPEED